MAEERAPPTAAVRQDASADGLGGHLLMLLLGTAGYGGVLVGAVGSAWAAPQLLGWWLDRTVGPGAAEGVVVSSAFDIAFAAFPIVFATGVVAIDLILIRRLTGQAAANRRGLIGWGLLAVSGLTLLLVSTSPILPPYGLVRLLSAPLLGVIGIAIVTVAAGVAGIAGLSVPVRLHRDGVSLVGAGRRSVSEFRAAPTATIAPVGSLVVGWGIGSGFLFVGVGLLGLALGLFVFGVLLLPVVLAVWVLAGIAFAAGHVRYRLHTVAGTSPR